MLRRLGLTLLVLLVLGGSAALAASSGPGEVGPSTRLQNNGRLLTHARAALVAVGNFPTGGALTSDGRFYWTVSTGRGFNDVRIVSTASRRVVQVIPVPGASGGIAIDSRHSAAYVSGVADSKHLDQQRRTLTGREGDDVRVYRYDRRSGRAAFAGLLPVPAPPGTPKPQGLSDNTEVVAWPDRLAVAPNGRTLLVPLNLADQAAIVDVGSKRVRYVATGRFPYGAAITRDGRTGLVSNEVPGTVSAIDLRTGSKVKDLQVGGHLSHPEGIAVDPRAARAYVAIANSDEVAVIDTRALRVERTLSVARPEGAGTAPVALTVTPGGSQLLVAESGADEIAVFSLPTPARRASRPPARRPHRPGAHRPLFTASVTAQHPAPKPYQLLGRIPTTAYPADVAVDAARTHCSRTQGGHRQCRRSAPTLVYLSAKGVGVGPNRHGSTPFATNDDNANSFQYLPLLVRGSAGIQPLPSARAIAGLTRAASAQLHPSNAERAPADTPLRAGGPIKHVFYIVRENRTYDQVLGDDARGNGDPSLTLFGQQNTPNIHALVRRFPLLDHVFADSEASIDGHFVTSAAKVSDYVHKSWFQNYAARKRPYDFIDAVSWPQNRFLFDQAQRQGISYFNYGEAIAGTVPSLPGVAQTTDRDRDAQDTQQVQQKFANSDIQPPAGCYPNDASIGTDAIVPNTETYDSSLPLGAPLNAESRFTCFRARFTAQDASGTVPSFNYLVLPNDHTNGTTPGRRTPRAMVAENDYALGQIVDTISHSAVWKSSAIFVVEDDSQDGSDHIDAHRTVGAVISPFAKSGAVVHTRYDNLSLIRSLELILGMKPLGLFDNLATPMYDAFTGTPSNDSSYTALQPNMNLLERNGPAAPGAKTSQSFNLQQPDHIPQRTLDKILWQSVHGPHAQPPPPGPNAVREP